MGRSIKCARRTRRYQRHPRLESRCSTSRASTSTRIRYEYPTAVGLDLESVLLSEFVAARGARHMYYSSEQRPRPKVKKEYEYDTRMKSRTNTVM